MNRIVAALLLAITAALGFSGTALAHSVIVSTNPEDGAILTEAPAELTFTFNEPLLPDFVRFIAVSPDGTTGDLMVSGVDGAVATIAFPADASPGPWQVEYRVVSQDGHPVSGGITFTVGGAATPSPETSSATPSTSSATPDQSTPDPTPQPSESISATDTAAETSSSNGGWIIVGIAVAVLAIVAIVGVVLRNRST